MRLHSKAVVKENEAPIYPYFGYELLILTTETVISSAWTLVVINLSFIAMIYQFSCIYYIDQNNV